MDTFFRKICSFFKARKMMRTAAYILISLILLLIVLMLALGEIIKKSAAALGPVVAGVPVKIESVSAGFLGNLRLHLKGLTIGNPEGYAVGHMLDLKNFYLEVDSSSLFSRKIVIRKIVISGVDVNYETNLISSNLSDTGENINHLSGENSGEEPAAGSKPPSGDAKESSRYLQVDDLLLEDVKIAIAIKGSSRGLPIPIAPIHLQNLGRGPEGITLSALLQEVLDNLISSAGNLLKGGTESLGRTAGAASRDITNAAASTVKKMKGLFSSGEKEKKKKRK